MYQYPSLAHFSAKLPERAVFAYYLQALFLHSFKATTPLNSCQNCQ